MEEHQSSKSKSRNTIGYNLFNMKHFRKVYSYCTCTLGMYSTVFIKYGHNIRTIELCSNTFIKSIKNLKQVMSIFESIFNLCTIRLQSLLRLCQSNIYDNVENLR